MVVTYIGFMAFKNVTTTPTILTGVALSVSGALYYSLKIALNMHPWEIAALKLKVQELMIPKIERENINQAPIIASLEK